MSKTTLDPNLVKAIQDIVWMARRYADGRQTYAPSMFNEAYKVISKHMKPDDRKDSIVSSFPQLEEK